MTRELVSFPWNILRPAIGMFTSHVPLNWHLKYRDYLVTPYVVTVNSICGNLSVLLMCLPTTDSGPLLPMTWSDLIVLAVRLTSIGSRAFPVAGARIWNRLPLHVTNTSSQWLYKNSTCFVFLPCTPQYDLLSGPCTICCHLGHYKFLLLIDWLIEEWERSRHFLCKCPYVMQYVKIYGWNWY